MLRSSVFIRGVVRVGLALVLAGLSWPVASKAVMPDLSGRAAVEYLRSEGLLAGLQAAVMVQQASLKASNPDQQDYFGESISTSGDTVVVGAYREDSNAVGVNGAQGSNAAINSGAVYVFVRADGAWSQQAYLKASNTGGGDQFGRSVAISGDTVVVGADFEDSAASGVNGNTADNSAPDSGAAYVFVRQGGIWSQQAYLKASNPANSDLFGTSVAIDADTIVVGATGEDSGASGVNGDGADNSLSGSGAAYVFFRTGAVWAQQAYLKASNPSAADAFGGGVAVSGDTVVVGSELEDSAATGVNGNQADESAINAGAAYVFVRAAGDWTQQAYLKQSNTGTGRSSFGGKNVAISGDMIVVGAPLEDSNAVGVNGPITGALTNSGAAYVFVRQGNVWSQSAHLKASNPAVSDEFGSGVAVSNSLIVVGARLEDSPSSGINGGQGDGAASSGAVYVFQRPAGTWEQMAYVKASNTGANDQFGYGVGVSGSRVMVSAPWEDSPTPGVNGAQAANTLTDSGAAYIFVVPGLNELPVAITGGDVTAEANSPDGALVELNGTASFDADGDPLTFSWTNAAGTVLGTSPTVVVNLELGLHTLTLTVSDGISGSSSASVIVKVEDTIIPTIVVSSPASLTYVVGQIVDVTYQCSDNGSGVDSCVGTLPNGSVLDTSVAGAFVFSVVASDVAGNVAVANVAYVVRAICELGSFRADPGDAACTLAPAGSYVDQVGATSATLCAVGSFSAAPGATACTLAPADTYVPTPGATAPTACPAGLNSPVGASVCADTTAPVLSGTPNDVTVVATDAAGAVVTFASPTASDFVDGDLAVTCTPPSGAVYPIGQTTVSCVATDAAGNGASTSFVVTVRPVCSAGSFLASPTDEACTLAAAGSYVDQVGATSATLCAVGSFSAAPGAVACTLAPADTFVPTPGATAPTACPAGLNSPVGASVCADTTAPVMSGTPNDVTVVATDAAGAVVTFTSPTAFDFVDGDLPVTCTPPSGAVFPVGQTSVSCVATDAAGNGASTSFVVTVRPVCDVGSFLASPSDEACTLAPAGSYVDQAGATSATLCAVGTFSAAPGATACTLAPADTYVPTPGATAPTACPAGLNSPIGASVCADTTAPVMSGTPGNISVVATVATGASVSYPQPVASDTFDGSVPVSCAPSSGTEFPIGQTTVTCVASDTAGNVASSTFLITVTSMPPDDDGIVEGEMRGNGFVREDRTKYDFNFRVMETLKKGEEGTFKLKINHPAYVEFDKKGRSKSVQPKDDAFEATEITQIAFSDWHSPDTSVVFSGVGKWNGKNGYTFQVEATDGLRPGRDRESISVVIRDGAGTVVASFSGELAGGNIRAKKGRK